MLKSMLKVESQQKHIYFEGRKAYCTYIIWKPNSEYIKQKIKKFLKKEPDVEY